MMVSRHLCAGVAALALVATTAARADAVGESQCEQIRAWVAGVPGGTHQTDQLLEAGYFSRSFGKPYEQLTVGELRQLQTTTGVYCYRLGNMTPQQFQVARELLNESAQQRWVATPGHHPGTTTAASPDQRSLQDKMLTKMGLKKDAPTPTAGASASVQDKLLAAVGADPAASSPAAPAAASAPAKRSWKDRLKDRVSQITK